MAVDAPRQPLPAVGDCVVTVARTEFFTTLAVTDWQPMGTIKCWSVKVGETCSRGISGNPNGQYINRSEAKLDFNTKSPMAN